MALTTLILLEFYTPLTHVNFFKIVSVIPRLVVLQAQPADGVFPELDILDLSYSPDLAPPHIPQSRGQRISLEKLMSVSIGGKPSFCSAFMNECRILNSCSLEIDCKDSRTGLASDVLDEILPRLRDRIEATLAVRHDFDDEVVTGTQQTLEIDRDWISILDDTRHAPVQCNTTTKLTIANRHVINHPHVLPQVLQAFGAPARPCTVSLKAQEAIRGGQHWRGLLDWLGGFDDCLNEVKFVDDHAFRFFAPLFTAVSGNGEAICANLVELHFQRVTFGVGTANQAALLSVLDFREEKGVQLDRLLFDECDGVHADDFPVELEILIDDDRGSDEDEGYEDDKDEDMSYEDEECDGNESDATIGQADSKVRTAGFEDEDDTMEIDS